MNPLVIIFLSVLLTCDSVPTTTEEKKYDDLIDLGLDSDKPKNPNETTYADLYNDQYWSYLMECGGCYDPCYYSCDNNSTAVNGTAKKPAGDTETKILREAANSKQTTS
nr:expressed protein [Hymenolepis microstoma]